MSDILIVDDEADIRDLVKDILEDEAVLKVGVGVSKDAKKLLVDYGVKVMGLRSLDGIAAKLRPGEEAPVGLGALAFEFLKVKMDKSREVREKADEL